MLADTFPPETKLAVFWAGIPAYFTNFRMVDIQGYNDRHIAHLDDVFPQRIEDAQSYIPGHNKHDLDYTMGTLKPDLAYDPWLNYRPRAFRLLLEQGFSNPDGGPWVREPASLAAEHP